MFFTDKSQSHLFVTSNKEGSLQNIQANDQVADKASISANNETSNTISDLANTQQETDTHVEGRADHVQTREVEDHSTNVTTQHLQTSGKARTLTSQLLLSGVQTIPEQLPLILTEGDAEEHESLAIIAGHEQLQVKMNVELF